MKIYSAPKLTESNVKNNTQNICNDLTTSFDERYVTEGGED